LLYTNGCVLLWIESGGGVALLYASRELEKIQTANFDQKIGVQIIQNALKVLFEILIVRERSRDVRNITVS
jgi:chaperonin GroEL (HSP60 family)